MPLILASNNSGKIKEIKNLLPGWDIRSMRDAGYLEEIPEPFESFRENAFQKANTLYQWSGISSLADDSGLCVHALNNAPGVHSAHYAGQHGADQANNEKLLAALQGKDDRSAHYVAVLCLILNGSAYYFEAQCPGTIAPSPRGNGGFGYDPLFIPDGYNQTFGELDPSIKKTISHRAKALAQLVASGLLGGQAT
ncbi:MAG: RdgB/HAM1 family non-canonical purine NTP pyrophosphatase [Bacteroidetes bacterium]|nr:RdgB/HAM1 family non-canonical purine NTP pyrophosphatase [Bacteroidota bacterium]